MRFQLKHRLCILYRGKESRVEVNKICRREAQALMASSGNGSQVPCKILTPEAISLFSEGISLTLSKWTALQMAVENEWGGRDSRKKSAQFSSDIFSWFTQSKGTLYIDDLEAMLDETMTGFFNMELEDGSIEEVAENLMIMHEACLQSNYESIEKLRTSNNGKNAVSQSRQVVNENDDDSSSDDDSPDMLVDELKPRLNSKENNASVSEEMQIETVEAEVDDGWSVVSTKRNRGKKH